jgi:probable rRNA maturation factor
MTARNHPSLLLDNRVKGLRLPRKKLMICLTVLLKTRAKKRLEIIFVGKTAMQQLNRDFHHVDKVTDVLAFPYDGDFLGEVFVCPEVARQAAKRRGLSFTSELALYAVHGSLHLLGYDDHSPKDIKKMRQKEVQVLALAGLKTDRLERSLDY